MASLIYEAMVDGMAGGSINFGSDSFSVMLTHGYTPDKAAHTTTADVTNEASGGGYAPGGASVAITITDPSSTETDIGLGGASWPSSTIDADGAVYYDATNSALVAYIDFGGTVSSLSGLFSLDPSTIKISNP
jgi:hypothetical protein